MRQAVHLLHIIYGAQTMIPRIGTVSTFTPSQKTAT